MIHVALCDNEINNYHLFKKLFNCFSLEFGFTFNLKYFKTKEELMLIYKNPKNCPLQLIILHVGNNGLSGFDTANSIRKIPDLDVQLVFFSDQLDLNWILDSLEVQPIQFWIKPISYNFFCDKMFNICKIIISSELTMLCIHNKTEHIIIKQSSVIAILKEKHSVAQNMLHVITENGNHLAADTLYQISERLGGYPFLVIYRSIIVNILKISKFTTHTVTMKNGDCFPIGRTYLKEIKKAYQVLQNNFLK